MLRAPLSALSLVLPLMMGTALLPMTAAAQEPDRVMISIYHVAPGKHVEFLRWQAARDAAATDAGLKPAQWYAHVDGDSWDYVSISPITTDAQDEKVDSILKGKKLTVGYKAAIEFRTMIASHTDTMARGPTTASALVDAATK